MPDISEEQLGVFQRGMALLSKMETDPRSKPHLEAAVKVHHPEVKTSAETMAEAAAPLLTPLQETLERVTATLDEMKAEKVAAGDRAAENTLVEQFTRLRGQGLTEEGETAVKQLMVDRNIADPEAAFALFERNNPKPVNEAPAWQPDGWDLSSTAGQAGGAADVKGLFENEDAWADREATNVLNEIRLGKAA